MEVHQRCITASISVPPSRDGNDVAMGFCCISHIAVYSACIEHHRTELLRRPCERVVTTFCVYSVSAYRSTSMGTSGSLPHKALHTASSLSYLGPKELHHNYKQCIGQSLQTFKFRQRKTSCCSFNLCPIFVNRHVQHIRHSQS